MTFLELAAKRVSVRGYDSSAVSDEDLNKVLEAGRMAPSAANRQPYHFIVVRDEKRQALGEMRRNEWFSRAPIVIVVCVEPDKAWSRVDGKNYADVDGAIAMDHMTLCAVDLGLGTCWIGAFDPEKVKSVLNLPPGIEPLAMTPLGKPIDRGSPKKRKSIEDLVHYNHW
jgi:nitroreductase